MGEGFQCTRLLERIFEEESREERHLSRTRDGREIVELVFDEWPLGTVLRTICVDEDKLPVIILDLPSLLEAFNTISEAALLEFMRRLLWILGKYRLIRLAATRGGLAYLEMDLRELPAPDDPDEAYSTTQAARTAVRLIQSWMVLAYKLLSQGESIPPMTIDDLIEKYSKKDTSQALLRI